MCITFRQGCLSGGFHRPPIFFKQDYRVDYFSETIQNMFANFNSFLRILALKRGNVAIAIAKVTYVVTAP